MISCYVHDNIDRVQDVCVMPKGKNLKNVGNRLGIFCTIAKMDFMHYA